MALVDPNIAMGYRGIEVPNQLAQYAQIQQIQNAQNQNRMANLQVQEYERAREEEEGTRNFLRGRKLSDPDTLAGLTQFGKTGLNYAKQLQEQNTAALTAKNTQSQIDERELGVRDKKLKFAWNAVGSASTPEAAIAELTKGVKDGVFDMKSVTPEIQQLQNMSPADYQQYRVQKIMGILDAKDKLGFMLPKVARQDVGGQILSIQDNPALPGYGQPIAGAVINKTETFADRNARGNLAVAQQNANTSAGQLNVAQKRLAQESDPAFQQRMTNARATGELIAKNDVAAIQALPKVIGDAEMAVGVLDQMVGKRDSATGKLLTKDPVTGKPIANNKPHPGFAPAVGMGGFGTLGIPGLAQITPGTDAANFKTLYDQITGAAFSEAFETLKGGGSITEKEGLKATAARNRMSLAQSEDEFVKAALEYRDILAKGVERAQSKAAKATNRMTPAAPAAGGVIDFGSLQ